MLRDKLNLVLIVGIAIAICGIVIYSSAPAVKAVGTLTTIHIVAHDTDVAVATITFPAGAPSATVSTPYNSVNGSGNPQFLDGSSSIPVVRLRNTSGGDLTVWLAITGWTNGIVTAEHYELVNTGNQTIQVVNDVLSATGASDNTSTGVTMLDGEYRALYLQVTLSTKYGKSGISTLTILGE